jgi:NAD(P)-dependent dehydrogenase (short-subunit alcohol dehydrogenase family)
MKTVLITGVNRGIGKALAQKFLTEGWCVIGTSRSGIVDYQHDHLTILPLDLTLPSSIEHCRRALEEQGAAIDILINNAGAVFDEDETKVRIDLLRKTLEVNLIGTIDFCERVFPLVIRGGRIVFISSSAGSLERTGAQTHYPGLYPAYKVSKAAINMYMRTLAFRLRDSHIVSAIHPGWVKTDMGGVDEADITPEQSAQEIYDFVITRPETGNFWFNGQKMPW